MPMIARVLFCFNPRIDKYKPAIEEGMANGPITTAKSPMMPKIRPEMASTGSSLLLFCFFIFDWLAIVAG